MSVGRFAPSPTGTLHIGNLRTALAAWLFARSTGSHFLLRFEDLDDATARPEHEASQVRDLETLGLDWDGEVVRQSDRLDIYRDALADLQRRGLTYRCWCSRREIREAASAPHGELVGAAPGHYPGTCHDLTSAEVAEKEASNRPAALRIRAEAVEISITDRLHGVVTRTVDDFVLRRGDGTPAYNLVVVVDDADQGIEEVVRADDLLLSSPRHALLQDMLGLPRPALAHVPLVLAPSGERLAKRDGAVTLSERLDLGDAPERVVAAFAHSLGLLGDTGPVNEITPQALISSFDAGNIDLKPWKLNPRQIDEPW
ncbi:MAG: tRNA glutamyl-Q(34) synthetase GluQRS [Acidimicrobiales bacterium]|nr:tRNA glutamyl-Q(34) synthetase GluQRS [Acidimicrobiales bacterium]MDG2217935.1 tRNA glutamyl-Q(34) synthetase GluQRS [Acidimicrobiales bacterium]